MTEQQDQQERMAVVALGIEAEAFIASPLGRALMARAESERAAALEALVTVDPTDAKAIQARQNAVRIVDAAQQWIADVITAGDATARALIEEESDRN